jgi:methyl-accepting chemotaxis protein
MTSQPTIREGHAVTEPTPRRGTEDVSRRTEDVSRGTQDVSRRGADARLLRESLDLLAPVAPAVVAAFYEQLFADNPTVRSMFPEVMDLQRERLLGAIVALAGHYDEPEQLVPALTALGRNHVRYETELVHYAAVGEALLAVLRRFAGEAWSADYEGAWRRAYTFAAGTMMVASALAPRAPESLAA